MDSNINSSPITGILFHLEDNNQNVYSGSNYSFNLWRETAKSLNCNWYGMIDITSNSFGLQFKNQDEEMNYQYYTSIHDAIQDKPNITFVILETEETLNKNNVNYDILCNYKHKENSIYIVGPDSFGINENISYPNVEWVAIPNMKTSLWSFAAAVIALYHRKEL